VVKNTQERRKEEEKRKINRYAPEINGDKVTYG